MSSLMLFLLWSAAQVTLITVLTLVVYFLCVRLHIGRRAALATSFALIVMLTVAMFMPLPSWFDGTRFGLAAATDQPSDSQQAASKPDAEAKESAPVSPAKTNTGRVGNDHDEIDLGLTADRPWRDHAAVWLQEMARAQPQAGTAGDPARVASGTNPLPWILAAIAGLVIIGIVRLAWGATSVRRLRQQSIPVFDPEVVAERDRLCAEIRCRRIPEIRESAGLVSAAMIGWFHPTVLLPIGWRDWTEQQRRAVLAHEIAHVAHGDFAALLGVQLAVLLHFYHPLVHWLASRFRLEQELEADAAAAAAVGGSRPYLRCLAELALEQDSGRVGWAAHTFLPTRTTFLRRIEMLRNGRHTRSRLAGLSRALGAGLLLIGGLFIAGVRPAQVIAEPESTEAANFRAVETEPASLAYVGETAQAIIVVRPKALISNDGLTPLKEMELPGAPIENLGKLTDSLLHLPAEDIDQITFVLGEKQEGRPMQMDGLIVHSEVDFDDSPLAEIAEPVDARIRGKRAYSFDIERASQLVVPVDDNIWLIADSRLGMERLLSAGPKGVSSATWKNVWNSLDEHEVIWLATPSAMQFFNNEAEDEVRRNPTMGMFSPLWELSETLAFGIKADDRLRVKIVSEARDSSAARELEDVSTALMDVVSTMLDATALGFQEQEGPDAELAISFIDLGKKFIASAEIERDDRVVKMNATVELNAEMWVAVLQPAVVSSRAAAKRVQMMNNGKQVGLAFHNYAATHNEMPAPIIVGPNGHRHSWRIAMLPYIEQQAMYNAYRFEEPWDSEHNLAVTSKMPAVFRHPDDPEDSVFSSYYMVTGEGTAFHGTDPLSFRDVRDGLSNTIMMVEAKRDVHWASPEDISIDSPALIDELGGYADDYFIATFMDGSVRVISKDVDKETLMLLLMHDDGQPIDYSRIDR